MRFPTLNAKVYLTLFLLFVLGIYTFFNTRLFINADELRSKTHDKTLQLAQKELEIASDLTLQRIKSQVDRLTHWDEVFQQLSDPTYYFYWKENSLRKSSYWFPYYDEIDLYDAQGQIISPPSPTKAPMTGNLPQRVPKDTAYFIGTNFHIDFYYFEPVRDRKTNYVIGYVGLSVDFSNLLLQDFQLLHVDKSSITIKKGFEKKPVPSNQLFDLLQYEPIKNPVNDFLWELIQEFIQEVVAFGALIGIVFALFFTRLVNTPLKRLNRYVKELQQTPDKLQPPLEHTFPILEIEKLKNSIFEYHRQLVSAHIEIDTQHQVAFEQARIDTLSHVFNRRAFDEYWNQLQMHFVSSPRDLCFLLFDCDFFKAINDSYGHEIGDDVIRISAATFKKALPLDTNLYRIGGDEFVAIIENRTLDECESIARRCYEAISKYDFNHLGIKEKVYYSIGMSFIDQEDSADLPLMNKHADIALYQAKKSLHNKIVMYREDMHMTESVLVSTERVNAIVNALHEWQHLYMFQQKVMAVDTQSQGYFEALIRIKQDDTIIYPDEILKVVQHRRLENEMDKAVLSNLYHLLQENKIPEGVGFSINITAQTLVQERLVDLFQPFQPYTKDRKIVIEILESTLISNLDEIQDSLQTLRSQGFKIALDDFGSGYSSIRYLAWMPVDIIKFDISLSQCLLGDRKTQKIIVNTASMIRSAGYDLVMEGIETKEMFDAAIKAGATHLQGYYIEKPKPIVA